MLLMTVLSYRVRSCSEKLASIKLIYYPAFDMIVSGETPETTELTSTP